jgi:hypothetical protein
MQKLWQPLVMGLALVGIGACATTEFKSTWKDPSAQLGELEGKRVAAFVVTPSAKRRRPAEDALAAELASRGVLAVPGYQLVPSGDLPGNDVVRDQLRELKVDGAVVMRVVERRRQTNYVPAYVPGGPGYASYSGHADPGWIYATSPGYLATNDILSVETLVYSVTAGKLLWRGVSETFDPLRVDSVSRRMVDKAADEMKKAGLIDQ